MAHYEPLYDLKYLGTPDQKKVAKYGVNKPAAQAAGADPSR